MKISDLVKKCDPQNQFEVLIDSYTQIEYAWNNKFDLGSLDGKDFNSIFISGLGGSAISADLIQNFLFKELSYPLVVNRNYYLPEFVNDTTLVIISSYSGNTEETLSVFEEALERKCTIICLTTGGKIGSLAKEKNIPVVNLLKGYQPRYSLGISFFSLLKVLQDLKLIENQDPVVNKIIDLWKNKGKEYSEEDNAAYKFAGGVLGFIPIIYSAADLTSAVGYRFKCQFNENSKLLAFNNNVPELNHNELVGWETFSDKQLNAKLINIIDEDYHPQVMKRFRITSELAAKNKVEFINIESEERDFKVRIMDLVFFCDWITYYTAILRNYDPSEIKNIDIMKERLV